MIRLSVITINYNNRKGLEETILSVISQTSRDFEYILVDGASTDGSVEVIEKYSEKINKWISEPDSGIYNAMNKAVKLASGEYCLFINSGDLLYRDTTIDEIYKCEFDEDFVEGAISFKERPNIVHYPVTDVNLSYYKYVTNNFHQASLIKRSMLLDFPYDENFKIVSDMKFNIESIILRNCSYKGINTIISYYEAGGRSVTIYHEDELKKMYLDLFPERVLRDYDDNRFLHEWPVKKIYPLLYKIGNNINIYKFRIFIRKMLGIKPDSHDLKYLDFLEKRKTKQAYSLLKYELKKYST